MLVGYARTSTTDQVAGFDAQKAQLEAVGCEKLFVEQVSAVGERQQLKEALAFMREGDALVVTKADRLARSTAELLRLVEDLEKRGIGLRILSMNGMELDTRQATSKLMLTILGAVAEFERSLMLERQREGIAKAKAEKRYKGRAPTARRQLAQMQELKAAGLGATEIARRLGVNRSSVYRLLA
jgi:DNA invertase Pin-like site-specific DNA recombinase